MFRRHLLLTLALPAASVLGEDPMLRVNFESAPLGRYQEERAKSDWPGYDWGDLASRAEVVADPEDKGNRVLKVTYPAGKIGSEASGAQFLVRLPKATECTLTYRVRFGPGFEWTRGGKLPGLTSRGTTFTGGKAKPDGTGWSARYMWRPEGKLVVYLYHMDMPDIHGEDVVLEGFQAEPERWYRLRQRIRVNEGDRANGILQVWIDDRLVLDRKDIRFRIEPKGLVDCFYFSTFYGGSTQSFAPKRDQTAYFDDFAIEMPR